MSHDELEKLARAMHAAEWPDSDWDALPDASCDAWLRAAELSPVVQAGDPQTRHPR